MKSSVTYQAIIQEGREVGREEGRTVEARAIVLRMGRKKLGWPPTMRQQATLDAIAELPRLEALADRLLDANSWAELLAKYTASSGCKSRIRVMQSMTSDAHSE